MKQDVTSIKIYSRENASYQEDTPSQVTVSYSSDGTSWTVAKTISNIPQPTFASELFFDEIVNFQARYVKFAFVNDRPNHRGVQVISEIEIYGSEPPPVLLTPAMTGNTAPSPYVVTSNSTDLTFPSWQAFDQNKGSIFHSGAGQQNDFWIAIDLGVQKAVSHIKIYSRENASYQEDTPSQVTVSHSSNGTSWTVAKTISNIPQPASANELFFDESINFEARHVKFAFVNNRPNNRGVQAISEIEIYGIEPLPAAPSSLAKTASSATTITLSWTASATPGAGYELERSSDGINFVKIADLPAGTTSYTDKGLSPGTTYTYRIRSKSGAGYSDYSAIFTIATEAAPTSQVIRTSDGQYWEVDSETWEIDPVSSP